MASTQKISFPGYHPISFCVLFLALFALLSPSPIYADGEIDTSFGTNGLVSTNFGQSYDGIDSLILDGDGNIVAGGCSFYPEKADFALARYKPNGELDTSFGLNGLVSTDLCGGYDLIESIVLDGNGNIVAGGSSYNPQDRTDGFALARYKPNGELDTSFGTDGLVFTYFGDGNGISSLVIDSGGYIVAGGSFYKDQANEMDFALARYTEDGELDPSFGTRGLVSTDFNGWSNLLQCLVLDGDGNIVAGGYCYSSVTGGYDFVITRYTKDGELDTSFGTNGWVTTDFDGGNDFLESMIIDGDGNIVAGGYSNNAQTEKDDFVIVRYTPNGEIDISFGTGGLISTDFGRNDTISSLAIDSNGNIVAGGSSFNDGGEDEVFALARYTEDGELDSSFGTDGLVSADFGGSGAIKSLVENGNGDIVAGGFYDNEEEGNFAMARFQGTPSTGKDPFRSGSSGWCNITALPGRMILLALPLTLLYRNSGK